MIKVSLIFGKGNLNTGFNSIIARISHQNSSTFVALGLLERKKAQLYITPAINSLS